MLRTVLRAAMRARSRLLISALAACAVVAALFVGLPHLALAGDTPKTPVAPPGPAPVHRALPRAAVPNHGYPAGQRPPVVPPGTPAGGKARKLSAPQWSAVPKPGTKRHADGGPPPSSGGAANVLVRSGFALDDTSLVVYFDAADPGISGWASWLATVYDPATQAAQDSRSMSPSEAKPCNTPRQFCTTFGFREGWSLVDGHPYFVTVTVTLKDGTQVVSDPSGNANARTVASPPALPSGQSAGCACPNILSPTTGAQAVRGTGVETGTGGFTMASVDLKMAGIGVPFRAVRQYSSTNTTAGTLGVGWSWTYDIRVIPPATGQSAVTVRAEDGAQVTFTRAADGSYPRPPGVRSALSATGSGWQLVTPGQITYAFDRTGRLTSVHNPRGLGTTVSYTATKWTITDAAGRKVTVDLGTDGLVKAITLPDGRAVRYQYHNGLLAQVTDAGGATWSFGYTAGLLTTVTDPHKRVQLTNTYAGGRVAKQVDATGAVTLFKWDADNQEATTTDTDGVQTFDGYKGNVLVYSQNGNGDAVNHRYDPRLNPNLRVDAQGNQSVSAFDGAGNLTSRTAPDPFGFAMTGTFDGHNNLLAQTDGLGHKTSYTHTAFDELETITLPGAGTTKYQIDNRGLVTSVTDARGKVTTMAYDAAGNLIARTTPMGEKTTYAYDQTGRLISTTEPLGNQTRFAYDNLDRLRKTFAPGKKNPSTTEYDDLGQVVKTSDPLGDATTFSYTTVIGRRASTTDPTGRTTRLTYTRAGRLKSVTDPAGNKTTYTYDVKGNLATVVSPRGNVKGANPADFTTTYVYDQNDNLIRTEHAYPGGGFAQRDTRYDELNRATATIDPLGRTTSTTYDNDSQVTAVTDALSQSTTFGYDDNGMLNAVAMPAGGRQSTEYDAAGNPVRQTSATGGVSTTTYDDDGRIATTVDPRGNVAGANPADFTTTYTYDAMGRVVAITDPLSHHTRNTYDANGRLTGVTDANGNTTKYRYDDADRLVSVTGPDALAPGKADPQNNNPPRPPATTYTYDAAGRLTSRTDPNKHNTRYGYDAAGRLSSVLDPLGRQTTYAYDAEGDLTRTVTPGPGDEAPRSIVLTYDILDRKVGEDLGHGGTIYAWGYDGKDRITSLADPAGLRLQTYDEADRLTKVSRGDKQTFGYEYDHDGNVTSRTWPDGTSTTATFDAADRMKELTVHGGGTGDARYTFGYDAAGRLTTTTYPSGNGLVTDRAYDRAGRLSGVDSHDAGGALARFQLALDPVGNPTAITTTRGASSQTVGYTYDAANRVAAACIGAPGCAGLVTGKTSYRYDLVGNRTSETLTGTAGNGTTTYQYDSADELTKATTNGHQIDYAYDGRGDQTKAGNDTFTYNLDHTLASATVGGVRTSYLYDAQGLRLSATSNVPGGPRIRSWATDVNGTTRRPVVETTATPTTSTTRDFVTGPDGAALALRTAGQTDSYLPDWLGGVATMLNGAGQPHAEYDYDPYGDARTDGTAGNTPSTVDNPVRFAGGYQDPTLGSRYTTQARGYDPGTGRFSGTDPARPDLVAPATSSYAYVLDRPTVLVDPTGRRPMCDDGGEPHACAPGEEGWQPPSTSTPPSTSSDNGFNPDPGGAWRPVDPGPVVKISDHVLIHKNDSRYPALKSGYEANSGWHCLWLCTESKSWGDTCLGHGDLCPKGLLKQIAAINPLFGDEDPVANEGAGLIGDDEEGDAELYRRLADPQSMRGIAEDEFVELAKASGLKVDPMAPTAATGGRGWRAYDPDDPTVNVFWEAGDSSSPSRDIVHRGPYVKWQVRGDPKGYRVPAAGNPNPASGDTGPAPGSITGWRPGIPPEEEIPFPIEE
jgi:RHS repeat-associated protein